MSRVYIYCYTHRMYIYIYIQGDLGLRRSRLTTYRGYDANPIRNIKEILRRVPSYTVSVVSNVTVNELVRCEQRMITLTGGGGLGRRRHSDSVLRHCGCVLHCALPFFKIV